MTRAVSPRRIALFGLFGIGNLGNEGSLRAVHEHLRKTRPGAALTCICARPDIVAAEHGIDAVPANFLGFRSALARALNRLCLRIPGRLVDLAITIRAAGRYDAIVVPGTGVLDDFTDGPMGMAYTLFKWGIAARLRGARFVFVSIGAGPITHPVSRFFMKTAARLAIYRSFRDAHSRDYMASLGLDVSADPLFPDVAFKLTPPAAREPAPARAVGVGLMSYRGWSGRARDADEIYATYVARMTEFVLWLVGRGARVRLLIGETADVRAVNDVTAAVRQTAPDAPLAFASAASLADLMDQIADTEIVVATRFHNLVCAHLMGRPAISLGYAAKNDALQAEMGLGAYCQHVEALDVARLKDQFIALEAALPAHEAAIRARLAEFARAHAAQDAQLSALIDQTGADAALRTHATPAEVSGAS